MRKQSIEEFIQIEAIEELQDNNVTFSVAKNGDVSVFFELDLPEVFSLSKTDLDEKVHAIFISLLSSLPVGTTLHKMDIVHDAVYTEKQQEDQSFIENSMAMHFYGLDHYAHKAYLVVSYSSKTKENKPSESAFFKRYKNEYKDYKKHLATLYDAVLKVEAGLKSSGMFDIKRLSKKEIINLLKSYFTLDFHGKEATRPSIELQKDALRIGQKSVALLSLIEEGEHTEASRIADGTSIMASPFIVRSDHLAVSNLFPLSLGLGTPHILHQVFHVVEEEKEKKVLDRNMKMQRFAATKSNVDMANNMGADIKACKNPIRYYVGLMTWAGSVDRLNKRVSVCENAIRKIANAKAFIEGKSDVMAMFVANSPGTASENYRFRTLPLENAATMISVEGHYKGDQLGLTLCDRRGLPLKLDLWDDRLNNKNRLVVGSSGGGKSFSMNHLLYDYHHAGHHSIVLDIGNSYKRLCGILKGKYLEYDINDLPSLNPFGFKELNEDNKTFIRTLLSILWKGANAVLTNSEAVVLNNIIEDYYEQEEEVATFHRMYSFIKENHGNYSNRFDFSEFLLVLSDYTDKGTYAQFFSHEQEKDTMLDERFLVFELGRIKGHELLYPVITLIIIKTVMRKMSEVEGIRTTLVLDEAWASLTGAMGEFIELMFRTARKMNGEIILITQAATDVENSPIGQAIVQNVETYLLLEHSDEKRRANAQRVLGLTDHEVSILASIDNSPKTHNEIFIRTAYYCKVFRVQVSPEAVGAYTTKKSEVEAIQRDADLKYGGNMEYAISNFAEKLKTPN